MTVTILIIAITCIVSFLAFNNNELLNKTIFYPYIMQGKPAEMYRFITHGFIHANPQHLLFNMMTLYFFGKYVEPILGAEKYLIMYLSALVVSSVYSYFQNIHNAGYRSLGASGAVSAVVFSLILFYPWEIKIFGIIPGIIYAVGYLFYSMQMSKQNADNVGHDAHISGAIYGVIFTFISMPQSLSIFLEKIVHPSFLP